MGLADSAAEILWRNAWMVIPLVAVIAVAARYFARRAATRHVLWLVALLGFVLPAAAPLISPWLPTPRQSVDALSHVTTRAQAWLAASPPVAQAAEEPTVPIQVEPVGAAVEPALLRTDSDVPHVETSPPASRLAYAERRIRAARNRPVRAAPTSRITRSRSNVVPAISAPEYDGRPVVDAAPFEAPTQQSRPVLAGLESLPATPVPDGSISPPPALRAETNASSAPEVTPRSRWAELASRVAVYFVTVWAALSSVPTPGAAIWAVAAALAFAWILISSLRFVWRLHHARPAPEGVMRAVEEVASTVGLRRPPRAYLVDARISPMIWCLGRPRLLLPTALWGRLRESERRAIICHELAHLRRGDHWTCLAELVVTVLYWWHPLTWWVRRRLDEEADLSCDAWVTWLRPRDRRAYADALLRTKVFIAQGGTAAPAGAKGVTTLGARTLSRRLSMVLTETVKPRPSSAGLLLAGLIATSGWFVAPAWSGPPKSDKKQPVVVVKTITTEDGDESGPESAKAGKTIQLALPANIFGGKGAAQVSIAMECDECTDGATCDACKKVIEACSKALGNCKITDGECEVRVITSGDAPAALFGLPGGGGGAQTFSFTLPEGIALAMGGDDDDDAATPARLGYAIVGDDDDDDDQSLVFSTGDGVWSVVPPNLFGGSVALAWQDADDDEDDDDGGDFADLARDMQRMARDLARMQDQLQKLRSERRVPTGRAPRAVTPTAPPTPPAPPAPPAARGIGRAFPGGGGALFGRGDDADSGNVIVRSYSLPEGKLDALYQLMVRSDVPIPVSKNDGKIDVHATEAQHRVFAAFIKMIHPESRAGARAGILGGATASSDSLRTRLLGASTGDARRAAAEALAAGEAARAEALLARERALAEAGDPVRRWREFQRFEADRKREQAARLRELIDQHLRSDEPERGADEIREKIQEIMESLEEVLEQADEVREEAAEVLSESLQGGVERTAASLAGVEARVADLSALAEHLEQRADELSGQAEEWLESIENDELRAELHDAFGAWLEHAVNLCEEVSSSVTDVVAPVAAVAPTSPFLAAPTPPVAPAEPVNETFLFQSTTPAPTSSGGR